MERGLPQCNSICHRAWSICSNSSAADNAIESLLTHIINDLNRIKKHPGEAIDEIELKRSSPFIAESLLGHVRYATHRESS